MTNSGYNSARYLDPRTEGRSPVNRQAPGQPQDSPYTTNSNMDNGNWENPPKETKKADIPLPALSDLTAYAQLCCRKAYEDVAGWVGSIFERQVCIFH